MTKIITRATERCNVCGKPAYPHPKGTPHDPWQPICSGCGYLENDCTCPLLRSGMKARRDGEPCPKPIPTP